MKTKVIKISSVKIGLDDYFEAMGVTKYWVIDL